VTSSIFYITSEPEHIFKL